MPAEFGFVYPLWNYAADEGRLLEQVAGDVGVNYVTIPVVTGAQTQFRLNGGEAPHFQTEGGWHFRPSTKAYTGLHPIKARWFAGADTLAQARTRAGELAVRTIFRIDMRPVRALVDHERHLSQRNAWGQEVPFAGACACNPDLRELLQATMTDLGRYEPAGFEVVDWAPDLAADRAAARPLSWHAPARKLLDICFCASCRQVAEREGIDAEAAARSTRVQVERYMATSGSENLVLDPDPLLLDYASARAADCCLWLRRLAETDPGRSRLLVRFYGEPPLGNCAPWIRMVRIPPANCGPVDGPGWAERRAALTEIRALALPAWRPTFDEAADLVKLVWEAVRAGVTTIDFEGLSEAAAEAVTWLKQAVRYARRE